MKHDGIKWPREVVETWLLDNFGEPKIGISNPDEYAYNDYAVDDGKKKLYVNVDKCKWVAFKRGTGGTFESLVADYENITIPKAIEKLLTRYVGKIKNLNSVEIRKSAASAIQNSRKIKAWSILPEKSYRIKYKDRYSKKYINYLKRRGLNKMMIEKCYYSITNKVGDTNIDMSNYVIIPYYNGFGKIVHWTARAVKDNIVPRYYNYANAGDYVYNIDTDESEVCLCEGIFKALKFGNYGIAIGGKSLTTEQLNSIINKRFEKIILVPDFEDFNKSPKKFVEIMKILSQKNQNVFCFNWPKFSKKYGVKIKDIDEFTDKNKLTIKDVDKYLIDNAFEAEIIYKCNT